MNHTQQTQIIPAKASIKSTQKTYASNTLRPGCQQLSKWVIMTILLTLCNQSIMGSSTAKAYPNNIYTAQMLFEKTIQKQGQTTTIRANITYQFDPSFYTKARKNNIKSPIDAPIIIKRTYTKPSKSTDYIKLRRVINEAEVKELKNLLLGSKNHITKYEPKFLEKFDKDEKYILDYYTNDITRQGELFVFYCPPTKNPQQTNSWTIIANIGLNIRKKYEYKEILDTNGFHRFRGSDTFLASVIKEPDHIHGIMRIAVIGFFHALFAQSNIRKTLKSWTDIHNQRAIRSLKKMGFTQTQEFSKSQGRCQETPETFKKCQWNKYLLSREKFYQQYPCFSIKNIQQKTIVIHQEKPSIYQRLLEYKRIVLYTIGSMIIVSACVFVWHYKKNKKPSTLF